ncbi:WD repeat protein [Trichophyton equinum CBS 127.97]|uniref:ASTRA-associated protein 1 n=1 Tax=Trichophyton equinum (strain ATCC MYA-4606 / CBS 127.97) TaxID=559882 RepID=F2PK77_TRIEC|nr:WD repeat protein [Trichophyton equinum CBS 127.97]
MTAPDQYEGPSNSSQKHPPATPTYVLRGHASPIHSLNFYGSNSRLISGDADGWVVVWDMTSKRAAATWKAHEGSILAVAGVEVSLEAGVERRILTHGRDHKLCVWRLNEKDEEIVGKILPLDTQNNPQDRKKPWMLHSLSVNALNFCGFAYCFLPHTGEIRSEDATNPENQMLLAVPNALNTGGLDIFHLPSEKRLCVISPEKEVNTGMVMALEMFIPPEGEDLYIISGYEEGSAMVHACRGAINRLLIAEDNSNSSWSWELLYKNRPHSQPILSLDISPCSERRCFVTSSADAMVVKHPIPRLTPTLEDDVTNIGSAVESAHLKAVNTKHSGQQGLRIRSDDKIFATAGWDNRIRVYSCRSMKELAVLKWHKEGCYSIAFAQVNTDTGSIGANTTQENKTTDLTIRDEPRSLADIKQQRSIKAQLTHWIAAGSKDGKVSLWDIY